MTVGNLLMASIGNFLYFRRLPIPAAKKRKIFFAFLRINGTYIFLVKLFRIRLTKMKLMGFRVEGYDYASLCFLFNEIFFRGEYACAMSVPAPTILDCGANIGMASLFLKWVYPDAVVHCFEPNPEAFALLKKNIDTNRLSNVHLHNVALTDADGEITFYTDADEQGSLRASLNEERMGQRAQTVIARKLSTFIEGPIHFFKLDVEGAETAVFRDLLQSGALRHIEQMVIEYHHHMQPTGSQLADFLKPLEERGFEYQLNARAIPVTAQGQFQDILIYAYRLR